MGGGGSGLGNRAWLQFGVFDCSVGILAFWVLFVSWAQKEAPAVVWEPAGGREMHSSCYALEAGTPSSPPEGLRGTQGMAELGITGRSLVRRSLD